MQISTDTDKCIGAGQCLMLAPDVFDQGDDGIVILLEKSPADEFHKDVREAASLCPSRSIRLEE
ncbi:ferredoxin [Streptomyces silaceus]|uniref:ferredoxin n=1 Tax=Streptomyces silaceus TaxID=545123 RepID=UPI0006EBDD02|nr:ferredoxin [Streptomyces silaceus]MCF3123061.1 ferredoxin [Streptomyces arenae]